MSKKTYLFLLLSAICLKAACFNSLPFADTQFDFPSDAKYKIELNSAPQPYSQNADSLFFIFRIIDTATNKKSFIENIESGLKVSIEETGNNPPRFDKVERLSDNTLNQNERISKDAMFWLMIDRSNTIDHNDMQNMKETIKKTIESLPDKTVSISFFDKSTTENRPITKSNFDEFEDFFMVQPGSSKNLYDAIINKFAEFSSNTSNAAKYLLIFTDGKINTNSPAEVDNVFKFPEQIKNIDNEDNNVQIHAFRYGEDNALVDMTLENVCSGHRKPGAVGGFYPTGNVASVIDSIRSFIYDLSADYKLTLINPSNKIYNGQNLDLSIVVEKDNVKMAGHTSYYIGSKENPFRTGGDDMLLAVVLGVFLIFIAFFIIQVVIPYLRYKFTDFEKKYVQPYQPEGDVYEVCFMCLEPFEPDEKVVVKCCHKTHWYCWEENGHKCTEYGQHCKEGVQYYFDKNHPFDLSQSPYFLKWAMSGMFGGFLIWMLYRLCFHLNPNLIKGFISRLLQIFYPEKLKNVVDHTALISSNIASAFQQKISGFLLIGLLLGFVLTFLFTWINDYRQKKINVILYIMYRGLLGAIFGFLSFLLGSIFCIALGKGGNYIWIDWIPWLLFGGSIALCLSLASKATIKWQDALVGGIISGIISFFALYLTSFLPSFGVMLGFMLCSTGLGVSIVAKHQAGLKYYLKYKGERKEGEIAIHKWMDESGGSNEVSIGKSNHCIIQMNWDNSEGIEDKHVKLYIDKKRKVPVLKVLEKGMSYDGRAARKDDLNYLTNGVKFKIGHTEFQYVER